MSLLNPTLEIIFSRRSIREYNTDQIKDEELKAILQAGRTAPSGMNGQPWNFSVVQNSNLMGKMNDACKEIFLSSGNEFLVERAKNVDFNVFYNAPTLVVVSADTKSMTSQYDCALALGNMFLAAKSINIASCWIHALNILFDSEEGPSLMSVLKIPEGYKVHGAGVFGYSDKNLNMPPRKEGNVTIIR